MKRNFFRALALILVASVLCISIGCSSKQTASDSNKSDAPSSDGSNSSSTVTDSSTSQGSEKLMAYREYFKNNPVKENKTFDVKLRDSKTTRTMKVLSNDLRLTEVTISPINGKRVGSSVTVAHFSDIHFNAVNDADKANPTIMKLYEGRDFNKGNEYNTAAAIKSLEFAKLCDRTVITGDIIDHFSYGSMELLKSVITDKYDVLMTLGNHETAEIMPSINGGMPEKYTIAEKIDYLNKNYWTNDAYLYSEILKNKEGNEKAMLLLMDNSTNKYLYTEKQYEELKGYINTARQKQIPILVFQHCPISTGWGDADGRELVESYDVVSNSNGMNVNFGKSSSMPGGAANNDAMTQKVYELIVSNGDVIKGIFVGHEHSNIYTEVMATLPDGANVKIPQYTVSGNYAYSNVIQITVL